MLHCKHQNHEMLVLRVSLYALIVYWLPVGLRDMDQVQFELSLGSLRVRIIRVNSSQCKWVELKAN